MMPIKLICASLNFQRLDAQALKELSNAYLNNNPETILNFKAELGFPVEQLAIIEKCNAVILVFCYYEDLSEDFIQGRILSAWDKLSQGGIIKTIKYIKFFDNIDAIKYLGECSLGLHSVTLEGSQGITYWRAETFQSYRHLQESIACSQRQCRYPESIQKGSKDIFRNDPIGKTRRIVDYFIGK